MPTYKLTIEYEGTRYSGWQAQGNTPKTVQGRLIAAARQVLGEVDLGGAGRTDAGVHAAGQVAHLRVQKAIDPVQLARKINDLLPHDINILTALRVSDRFHARHDATTRVYLYQIATRRTAFAKPFVWWIKDRLDVEAMQQAAAMLPGRHDFTAFSDRRIKEEDSRIVVVDRCEAATDGHLILLRIEASHFLWKMVRKLIAFLVEIGRGEATSDDLATRLTADGEHFAPTAPPSGLFLEAVTYREEGFGRPLAPIVPVP
jgi:tRNA pseudouridine38-40 synthase